MKNLNKAELQKITEIAQKHILAIENRGDLEQRCSDDEDFFETSIWGLKNALIAAYNLGKESK